MLEEDATVAGKHVVDTDVLGTAPEPHTDLEGDSRQGEDQTKEYSLMHPTLPIADADSRDLGKVELVAQVVLEVWCRCAGVQRGLASHRCSMHRLAHHRSRCCLERPGGCADHHLLRRTRRLGHLPQAWWRRLGLGVDNHQAALCLGRGSKLVSCAVLKVFFTKKSTMC